MPIINGRTLAMKAPIKNMALHKMRKHGVSWGLGEAGYDIRLKQGVRFVPGHQPRTELDGEPEFGRFRIASTIEEFEMPTDLVGIVHDKSSWARQGLSVFNTVIEPGWRGFLTLELVFHGNKELLLPAGCGIAQVIFSTTSDIAQYAGKYQDQFDGPMASIFN